MPKPLAAYTAAEIARALGSNERTTRHKLEGCHREATVRGKGRKAAAYLLSALPVEMQAQLSALATARGCRDATQWIEVASGREPSAFTADTVQRADAEAWARVLGPILQHRAAAATVAQLAREAAAQWPRINPANPRPSERAARKKIETAFARHVQRNGPLARENFLDLELYLPTAAEVPASLPIRAATVEAMSAARAAMPDDGRKGRDDAAWHVAFEQYTAMLASGAKLSQARAAVIKGLAMEGGPLHGAQPESAARQFRRLLTRWEANGRDESALIDQRKANGSEAKYDLSEEAANLLKEHVLKRDSFALGVEWFARDPECPPTVRAAIMAELDRAARERCKPAWPLSLRRAGHVSPEQYALFRGEKAFSKVKAHRSRGMNIEEADGTLSDVVPGTIFESDDMSLNEPFRFQCPETGEWKTGRQSLCTQDLYSKFWLSGQPIGRVRDAYRVEDIADHMLQTVIEHGLPRVWRLERGIWENIFGKGVELSNGVELPNGHRWGGLSALFHVQHVHSSNGKEIEGSFGLLQRIMAHESRSIGAKRGEFERANPIMAAAQRGDVKALAQFWEIPVAADGLAAAMHYFNNRPKLRSKFGRETVVPADQFQAHLRRECPAEELWRFCPVKREATVLNGCVKVTVAHYPYPFQFEINGVDPNLYLEYGYRVLIAFHPGRPEEGCHIFNAEDGARNRDGLAFGQKLLLAPLAKDSPQISFAGNRTETAAKKANAAMRSEFRGIQPLGRNATRASVARDGWGNSVERTNQPTPRQEPGAPAHVARRNTSANNGDILIKRVLTPQQEEAELAANLAEIARGEAEMIARGEILFP